MFMNVLLVGLGGALGSMGRYLMVACVNRPLLSAQFPFATLLVNVLGCLMIGFLGGILVNKISLSEQSQLFLFTGILGGFTTFSAFGIETFYFLRNAQWGMAFLNMSAQLILGIGATALGYWISKVF